MTEQSSHVMRIKRTFAAPIKDVFDAWTAPR